jgi:8-oxo-dGTP pyrophosphatase MutT (NUDIX family)
VSTVNDVIAAGGVVWREPAGPPRREVLLVHRPRYDDWSLPKGKLDPGESFEDAALREVWEETGIQARLERELPEVRYAVRERPKLVRYWLMSVESVPGSFEPNEEVDELRWLPLERAVELLSYDRDRELVEAVA